MGGGGGGGSLTFFWGVGGKLFSFFRMSILSRDPSHKSRKHYVISKGLVLRPVTDGEENMERGGREGEKREREKQPFHSVTWRTGHSLRGMDLYLQVHSPWPFLSTTRTRKGTEPISLFFLFFFYLVTQIIRDASACVWRRLFGGWEVGGVCVCGGGGGVAGE